MRCLNLRRVSTLSLKRPLKIYAISRKWRREFIVFKLYAKLGRDAFKAFTVIFDFTEFYTDSEGFNNIPIAVEFPNFPNSDLHYFYFAADRDE